MNKKPKLKVLFFLQHLTSGGAERFVSLIIEKLDRELFEPMLVIYENKIEYPIPDDVRLIVIKKSRPWHVPFTITRLRKIIDDLCPHIVHSSMLFQSAIAGQAIRRSNTKPAWIARIVNNPDREKVGFYLPWAISQLKRADLLMSVGTDTARRFLELYPWAKNHLRVFEGLKDFQQIDHLSAQTPAISMDDSSISLVAVGRLAPQKRYDIMLAAFREVRQKHNVRLIILGEGPLRGKLEELIRLYGINDSVTLAGFVPNPYSIISRCDLFIMSSDFEGLPGALVEAQGLGLPAVSTDCNYGPREVIAHNTTGLLVPPGDHHALAGAIQSLLSDNAARARMGSSARHLLLKRFSWTDRGREFERILQDLSNTHECASR